MSLNSDFKELLQSFNANQVKYLIIGGYAYALHFEPRSTKDLDIWVKADEQNSLAVLNALRQFGAPVSGMTPQDFTDSAYFFRMGVPPSMVDILVSVQGLNFDEAWDNRYESDYGGEKVYFISKKDLITAKLATGRPRDREDAENLQQSFGWDHLREIPVDQPPAQSQPPKRRDRRERDR
jgi:hypothetical protein